MLPMIMAKGKLAHCAQNIEGLNAAYMLAEAVRNIELNPELMSDDLGISTQSPSFQIMKDMKTTYDVSMPEYAVGCANILFLGEGRQRDQPPVIRAHHRPNDMGDHQPHKADGAANGHTHAQQHRHRRHQVRH